jgi:hypothetical protein
MIKQMQEEQGFTTAYHICNSYTTGKNLLGEILRSITVQFLRSNLDLAPFIFDNYANKGLTPSIVRLRKLLPELLATLSSIRIIVDGLDEYPESDQRIILTELIGFSKLPGSQCKILFSNREGTQINKSLTGKPTISLRDQADVDRDIEIYIHANLEHLRGGPLDNNNLIDWIEHTMVEKAKGKFNTSHLPITNCNLGMFLWVRLVMLGLDDCGSERDLITTVNNLPDGLDKASVYPVHVYNTQLTQIRYGRILDRMMDGLTEQNSAKALKILEWLACSFRIMKAHEIRDGIQFHTKGLELNDRTKVKLIDGFFNMCKPLIEEGPKNTIDFVHYSAKQ